MVTSLSVSEETRDELQIMKIRGGYSSIDEMLREMMVEHKKKQFREASRIFRKAMDEKGLTVEDLFE